MLERYEQMAIEFTFQIADSYWPPLADTQVGGTQESIELNKRIIQPSQNQFLIGNVFIGNNCSPWMICWTLKGSFYLK